MSMFSKLAGLAQKALSDSGSSAQKSGSGQTDWRSMVRTAADAITGDARTGSAGGVGAPGGGATDAAQPGQSAGPASSGPSRSIAAPLSAGDRAAIARYDYLLETADPRHIEQVHREAFDRLTPGQREQIQERMQTELPVHERPASADSDELARAAARTEAGRPGLLKGLLARASGGGRGPSGGRGAMLGGTAAGVGLAGAGLAAGGVLAAVAGGAVVSSVAGPLLAQAADIGVDFESLAAGIDVESLGLEGLGGLTGGVDELTANAGDAVSGFGDQISGWGDGFSLGDFFGR